MENELKLFRFQIKQSVSFRLIIPQIVERIIDCFYNWNFRKWSETEAYNLIDGKEEIWVYEVSENFSVELKLACSMDEDL